MERAMPELNVEEVAVSELHEYENNAKIHTREQVDQICKSIEEFGFNNPIGVWQNEDGILEIVTGHGRVMAAKKLGMTNVPIIRLDHMSDEQRRAYTHIENQLNLNTGFDFDTLDEELANLNFDWDEYGFDIPNLDFDNVSDLTDDSYEAPEHEMLTCPSCGFVDRKEHFKKTSE